MFIIQHNIANCNTTRGVRLLDRPANSFIYNELETSKGKHNYWHTNCNIYNMKVAITQWQNRVSPVFDVACTFMMIEFVDGREQRREMISFPSGESFNRVRLLHQLGVQVLICGAVSQPLESALVSAEIQVIPYICGVVDDVLKAYIHGYLDREEFLQPGYNKQKGNKSGGDPFSRKTL